MSLQDAVMTKMKEAMRAKDTVALSSLRAIKSALLLAQTDGSGATMSEADEIKIVQKLVKQRQDSAAIYKEQGREDLAQPELDEVAILAQFLTRPTVRRKKLKQLLREIIAAIGATGMQDMGKVMGQASAKLAGKADGKTISTVVKALLNA